MDTFNDEMSPETHPDLEPFDAERLRDEMLLDFGQTPFDRGTPDGRSLDVMFVRPFNIALGDSVPLEDGPGIPARRILVAACKKVVTQMRRRKLPPEYEFPVIALVRSGAPDLNDADFHILRAMIEAARPYNLRPWEFYVTTPTGAVGLRVRELRCATEAVMT